MELIELVEIQSRIRASDDPQTFEIYQGDWVELYIYSSHHDWYTVEWWQENHPELRPNRRRSLMVYSDGEYIGAWDDKEDFYSYLRLYLHGTITETITPFTESITS